MKKVFLILRELEPEVRQVLNPEQFQVCSSVTTNTDIQQKSLSELSGQISSYFKGDRNALILVCFDTVIQFGLPFLKSLTRDFPGNPVCILSQHNSSNLPQYFSRMNICYYNMPTMGLAQLPDFLAKAENFPKNPDFKSNPADKNAESFFTDAKPSIEEKILLDSFLGESESVSLFKKYLYLFSKSDEPVLFVGEPGTGKSMCARIVHNLSVRKHYPLEKVNFGSLSENLAVSELFGAKQGAFTDCRKDRTGILARAERSSLLLDEITEAPDSVQCLLLPVLQEHEYRPVGGGENMKTSARILATSNANIVERINCGLFRKDLWDRLKPLTLMVPPLRERGNDILLLTDFFCRNQKTCISRKAMAKIQANTWPGNVRELAGCIKRAALLSGGTTILPCHIQFVDRLWN